MCLGVPMQIMEIDGTTARCRIHGVERDVSLFLLQDQNLTAGDYVLVHVGYAIQQVHPDRAHEAADTWDAIQQETARDA